ncbi:MAG: hypothetical protein AB7H77_12765 [Bdellovibrionales bacterium]
MARDQKKLDEWDKKFAAAQTEQEKIAIVEEIRAYVREQARLITPQDRKKIAEELDEIFGDSRREIEALGLSEDERAAIVEGIINSDRKG